MYYFEQQSRTSQRCIARNDMRGDKASKHSHVSRYCCSTNACTLGYRVLNLLETWINALEHERFRSRMSVHR